MKAAIWLLSVYSIKALRLSGEDTNELWEQMDDYNALTNDVIEKSEPKPDKTLDDKLEKQKKLEEAEAV